jgi:hypothetical protein
MRGGLVYIPGQKELAKAYDLLLHSQPHAPTLEDLACFSQWSRFDPRLGEIWVGYVSKNWKSINPMDFRKHLHNLPWPSAAALLIEFVKKSHDKSDEHTLFKHWFNLVIEGISKAPQEMFFIGLRQMGEPALLEDARFPLQEFSKWGYFSRENLSHRTQKPKLSRQVRENTLLFLLEKKSRIRTQDYWLAIDKCISKRQAERDLERAPFLKSFGKTKGRVFSKK